MHSLELLVTRIVATYLPLLPGKRTIIRRQIRRMLLAADGTHRRWVTRGGVHYDLDLSQEVDLWVYLTGWFEEQSMKAALRLVKRGDVVIDVGAHIGTFSLRAARCVGAGGRVVAFEPNPAAATRLRSAKIRNGFDQLCLRQCAVGGQEGQAELRVPEQGDMGSASLFEIAREDIEETAVIKVELTTLDRLRAEELDAPISLIKIDVEGAELDVLDGARSLIIRDRPFLMLECNPAALKTAGRDAEGLLSRLRDWGYETYLPGWSGLKEVRLRDIESREVSNLICRPDPD